CGLPQAWSGRDQFTVAETGFGTGLNFLALWQMWRQHRANTKAWLHFVSFEGFPLLLGDAVRALSAWPELNDLSAKLLARWPDPARGVRRFIWPDEGVTLTLHVDDIAAALPQSRFSADAWFLDGFSPSRNGEMWDAALFPLMAERSAPGARVATFTVARAVRDGLSAAGFTVEKRAGFGRKRDCLEGVLTAEAARAPDLYALRTPSRQPSTIAILGAGIAGAALAKTAMEAGIHVTVFDPAGPASGASGNALALVMPRLDASDTPTSRILIDAYFSARAFYRDLPGVSETEVRQTPKDDAEKQRFEKVLADPPLPLEDLEALSGGGLLHKRALILRPREIISACLNGVETAFGAELDMNAASRTLNGRAFDTIVLANGMALAEHATWIGLVGKLGQVEHVGDLPNAPSSAVASGHYALADGPDRLWGATFQAADGPPVESEAARIANQKALGELQPWWRAQLRGTEWASRAGIRATTPDRLPIAGPMPDFERCLDLFAPLRTGQAAAADAQVFPGVYMLGGLGSRGFTFAPWLATLLVSQMQDWPAPAGQSQWIGVSPMRFIYRGLKRGVL
ncbi:MAG: FAD-dependent 5-carboxymethylaminomethyl-2-thiouridine(34) oxidoreductase MnmC, partial [Pseudomonadota bacterium]